MRPSRTTYLPFGRWPERDQLGWNGAVQAARLFGKQGAGAHWSSATREAYRLGYGRYLGFLAATGWLTENVPPASRVTPPAVERYHASLEGLADYTVVNLIEHLHAAVRAMAPDEDWGWLRDVARNLRRQGPRGRPKHQRVVDSKRLFDAGLALMEDAEAREKPVPRAGSFRDGLMLAMLASRPVRRANLAMMRIGRHLTKRGGAWQLEFAAGETKTRKPIELPLPAPLAGPLEQYLRRHRPALLRGRPDDALWISGRGKPMTGHAIYMKMIEVTKARLGRPINLHLFRDCLATSIAIRDPEHVRMATSLLGHNSARSTEDHYNQAQAIEASRLFQRHMAELSDELDEQDGTRGLQRR